jgi:hypothetical protein
VQCVDAAKRPTVLARARRGLTVVNQQQADGAPVHCAWACGGIARRGWRSGGGACAPAPALLTPKRGNARSASPPGGDEW